MPFTDSTKFRTAPYHELADRFGMKPRFQISRIDDQHWAVATPEAGLLRINRDEALHIMAVDALLWLRHEVGYPFPESDIHAQTPASVLRMVRDTARLLLS